MFQVDEAKAKADQLAQQLDATEGQAERAAVEAALREARDQVQALSDAQHAAGADAPASRSETRTGPQEASQVPELAEAGAEQAEAERGEQAPAAERAPTPNEGREIDRVDELYSTLQPATDPTPETTAAVNRWEQERESVGQVRELRDGESVTGTVESTVTVDGQSFNVLQIEHEDGRSERVMVPADPDHEQGDPVTASREGAEIAVHHDYGHGM
ncbi:hypothetical protein [Xanthomonas nasturtii]|uniref:hypothetical protein n=1 Tax=Xanthomonas nasturtii TaxID=1843581 RepID=UPI002012C163|nr:hypothetical protein [Xanthomonas nasturtii]MCL1574880.1 hypothetical protein [Xanthomonas nasturtii]MCL1586500.1 hypothetical protein [Xanthomonas nasturtii]